MSPPLVAALYGGVVAAIVSGLVNWRISVSAKRNNYYSTLYKLIADHNWNCLKENLPVGLAVTFVDEKTKTVCYQHINLLLYAWLHKRVIEKDGTLEGWKRWATAIVDGTKLSGNEKFGYAYRDILVHGDMCPPDFIDWLKTALQFSPDKFPVPRPVPVSLGPSAKETRSEAALPEQI